MKILFSICGDPGGAAAIVPVLQQLTLYPGLKWLHFTYFRAKAVLDKVGLPNVSLSEGTTSADIAGLYDQFRPSFLLCGTSVNSQNLEHFFLEEATVRGIPSLAVLDFWANYKMRFISSRTGQMILPQKIAVMDECALREMSEQGIDSSRIVVTGQPAFDNATPSVTLTARQELDISRKGLRVLFVSQTLIPGMDTSNPLYPGFTKRTVLPDLLAALNLVQKKCKNRISLIVRPHPRETDETFDWIEAGNVNVQIVREGSSHELASTCDLIVGLNSILLMECCLMGLPVLSLQPGLRGTDCLPTNRMGISRAVYERADISRVVEKLLLNPRERERLKKAGLNWRLPRDAANKVSQLAIEMIS